MGPLKFAGQSKCWGCCVRRGELTSPHFRLGVVTRRWFSRGSECSKNALQGAVQRRFEFDTNDPGLLNLSASAISGRTANVDSKYSHELCAQRR